MRSKSEVVGPILDVYAALQFCMSTRREDPLWRSNQGDHQLSAWRGKKWTTANTALIPALATDFF